MASPYGRSYSADGKLKMCRGALHKKGIYLPVDHFFILKSGRRAGKPMGECKDCWRHRQGTSYKVPVEFVYPLIARLVAELGSNEAVCLRLGVARNQISVVKHQETVRGTFVQKLVDLDNEIRAEQGLGKGRVYYNQDPQVVTAEPLGSYLRQWCKQYVEERPLNTPENFMGPVDFIYNRANRLSLMVTGKEAVSLRQVGRICNSAVPFVSFHYVDAILTATGQIHLLHSGVIEVIPNPQMSLEAYVEWMKRRGCI